MFIFAMYEVELKGILHQKIFYRLNLIFWIVIGCGIARFGQRGLKNSKLENFGLKVCPQGFRGAANMGS